MVRAVDPAKVPNKIALLQTCSGGGAIWSNGVHLCKRLVEGRRNEVAEGSIRGRGSFGVMCIGIRFCVLHEACEVRVNMRLDLGHEIFVVVAEVDDACAGGSD